MTVFHAKRLSDSEVITIATIGELIGMEMEARWYSLVAQPCRGLLDAPTTAEERNVAGMAT